MRLQGEVKRGWDVGVVEGRAQRNCETYQNDRPAEHHVPQQVLLPVELGMCCLQLTQVLEDEVCVHDYAQFGPCQEEAGDKSPNLGREFENLEIVEIEPPNRK